MTKCLASKHIDFIKLLVSYRKKSKQFKSLIKCASTEELDAISEVTAKKLNLQNMLNILDLLETHKKIQPTKERKHSFQREVAL